MSIAYRKRPADLKVYEAGSERSHCGWCCHSDNLRPYFCYGPPNPTGGHKLARLIEGAEEGDCKFYRPSFKTKLSRLFGFRKASMR